MDNVKKNPIFKTEFRNFRDSDYVKSLKERFSSVFALPDDLVTMGKIITIYLKGSLSPLRNDFHGAKRHAGSKFKNLKLDCQIYIQ